MNFLLKTFAWVPRLFKWGSRSAEGAEELRLGAQVGKALSEEDTAAAALVKKWGVKPKAEPIQESPTFRPQPRVDASVFEQAAPQAQSLQFQATGNKVIDALRWLLQARGGIRQPYRTGLDLGIGTAAVAGVTELVEGAVKGGVGLYATVNPWNGTLWGETAKAGALSSTPEAVVARTSPRSNLRTETTQIGLTDKEIAKYSDELAKKCPSGRFSESPVCN